MQISKLFHWKTTPSQAFNEFLYEFLRIYLISENSSNFFAEVTNSRSEFSRHHPSLFFVSRHVGRVSGVDQFIVGRQ